MIVEFVGPGGVGKTTVEPLVADRLGITYYPGRKRHGFDGEPLSTWRVWTGRIAAVAHSPRLSLATMARGDGSPADRVRLAADLARRNRAARRAALLGSGVLASGPVHALSMMGSATGNGPARLARLVHRADVYVVMRAQPEVITRRLAGRLTVSEAELVDHGDWVRRYERAADRVLSEISRPAVSVDAGPAPEEVADEVASLLAPYLAVGHDGQ